MNVYNKKYPFEENVNSRNKIIHCWLTKSPKKDLGTKQWVKINTLKAHLVQVGTKGTNDLISLSVLRPSDNLRSRD